MNVINIGTLEIFTDKTEWKKKNLDELIISKNDYSFKVNISVFVSNKRLFKMPAWRAIINDITSLGEIKTLVKNTIFDYFSEKLKLKDITWKSITGKNTPTTRDGKWWDITVELVLIPLPENE